MIIDLTPGAERLLREAAAEAGQEPADYAHRAGRPIGIADAWVASTALRYRIPLLTNNPDDFAGVSGLTMITV